MYAHYKCKGVPSLVFIDKNGEEIDRIVGFREPGDYLNSIKKISSNIETFFSLRNQYFSGEHSIELLSMLANKYDQQSKLDSANILYNKLSTYKLSKEMKYEVEYFKSKYQLSKNNDPSAITDYINTYTDSPYMKKAFLRKINFFRNQENKGFEIKTYIEAISSFPNDYSLLNRYAWRMTELDANLVDALSKSSHAISLIEDEKEKAMVIDTKAEILWKLNRFDEALDEIDKALRIDSENSYYIKQKSKFLNSKSN